MVILIINSSKNKLDINKNIYIKTNHFNKKIVHCREIIHKEMYSTYHNEIYVKSKH